MGYFKRKYAKLVEEFETAIRDWVSKRGKPMDEEPESYHIHGWEVDFSTFPGDNVVYSDNQTESVNEIWFFIPSYEEYTDEDYSVFAEAMVAAIIELSFKEAGE